MLHHSQVDPYLQDSLFRTKIRISTSFAARVREGYYGHGRQVGVGRVRTALRAVGQTCKLDIGVNPLYRKHADTKYLKPLERQLEGYRRNDPIPVPEIAIPVNVPNQVYAVGKEESSNKKDKAVGELSLIAFYYLLRVGEYASKKQRLSTRTKQFCLCNVTFWKNHWEYSALTATQEQMLATDAATLHLSNQKNGLCGSLIYRTRVEGGPCPVQALAERVWHMREHNALQEEPLCAVWDHLRKMHVTEDDILVAIRYAVAKLGLERNRISASRIGTHSYCAGGAMALKFAGADRDDIKNWEGGRPTPS